MDGTRGYSRRESILVYPPRRETFDSCERKLHEDRLPLQKLVFKISYLTRSLSKSELGST